MLHDRGVYIEAKPFSIGFPDRASAGRDRPQPFRQIRRPQAAGRRRLQGGASLQQRPRGLQLLHVPGRHGRRGDVRAGPRRDQRHEPVFAQRAQCERGHRRRHYAGRLSRRSARRHRVSAQVGRARIRAGRRRLLRARAARRRLHRGAAVDVARFGRAVVQAGRASDRSQHRAARLRDRGDPRSAARNSTRRSRALRCTTRC